MDKRPSLSEKRYPTLFIITPKATILISIKMRVNENVTLATFEPVTQQISEFRAQRTCAAQGRSLQTRMASDRGRRHEKDARLLRHSCL